MNNKHLLSIATHLIAFACGLAVTIIIWSLSHKPPVRNYCDAENMVYLYHDTIAVVAFDPRCVDLDVPRWDG